jgi:hypothetical protein
MQKQDQNDTESRPFVKETRIDLLLSAQREKYRIGPYGTRQHKFGTKKKKK